MTVLPSRSDQRCSFWVLCMQAGTIRASRTPTASLFMGCSSGRRLFLPRGALSRKDFPSPPPSLREYEALRREFQGPRVHRLGQAAEVVLEAVDLDVLVLDLQLLEQPVHLQVVLVEEVLLPDHHEDGQLPADRLGI